MKEYTEVEIDTPEFGQFKIRVIDIRKPLWFGDYESGKLAIYRCEFSDEPKLPCAAFIYAVTEQNEDAFNFWGYEILEINYSTQALAMINFLLEVVKERYLENVNSYRKEHGYSLH